MKITIEEHPWKIFPKNTPIEKLIIGSFPPNKMVLVNGEKTMYLDGVEKVIDRNTIKFDFFYGSEQNIFWELFINSLNLNLDLTNIDELKKWLKKNKWGVTDIVLTTTRKKDSPSDSHLVPKKWNKEIIENIIVNNNLTNIYFTSSWVKNKFDRIITSKIHSKINKHLLISPSPSGLRRIPDEIIQKYPKNTGENNSEFRRRCYKSELNQF
jgi:G:T/U-mismatch repair DNA glycosylase